MSRPSVSDWTPPHWLIPWISRIHVVLYGLTGGRVGGRVDGMPCILLRTTGRRSTRPHTVCLSHLPDGDSMVVVGSFGGADRHPAWYHNLVANHDVKVQDRGRILPAVAETSPVLSGRSCGRRGSRALLATRGTRSAPTGRSPWSGSATRPHSHGPLVARDVSVADPGFGLDAETVGNPVRVRVVADDLDYVEDVTIRETGRSKILDVGVVHRARRRRQLDREPQHRPPLG